MVKPFSDSPSLSIVIPLYNEEQRLENCFYNVEQLMEKIPHLELIFVNDGSSDNTEKALLEYQKMSWVSVLSQAHLGKGAAIRLGLTKAKAERVLICDVDWSVSPHWVPKMLSDPSDVVIAVREGHGARRIAEPIWRHLLGRAFNHYVQWVALSGHQDTQCGCKLLNRKAVSCLGPILKTNGWAFDVELLALSHINGLWVSEVPVAWTYDSDSRIRPFRDSLEMAIDVYKLRKRLRRGPTMSSSIPSHPQSVK